MFLLKINKAFIFNHHMTYQIFGVKMSISPWDRVHFSIYFLNQNSLSHQTSPIDRYKQGNNSQESFEQFGGLWLKDLVPRQFSNLLQLLDNQLCQDPSVLFFWKGE